MTVGYKFGLDYAILLAMTSGPVMRRLFTAIPADGRNESNVGLMRQ